MQGVDNLYLWEIFDKFCKFRNRKAIKIYTGFLNYILPKILNLGNLKYDYFERNKTTIKRNHCSRKIILFASLYKNEHKILFNVLNKIYRKGFIAVIAPRHISQAEKIYNFLTLNDFNVGLYSETGDSFEDYEIIIIDSFGGSSALRGI